MLEKPEFDGISTKDKNTLVDNNSALVGNVAMSVGTVFENYPKCRIRLFSMLAIFGYFGYFDYFGHFGYFGYFGYFGSY